MSEKSGKPAKSVSPPAAVAAAPEVLDVTQLDELGSRLAHIGSRASRSDWPM